jgi:hypothetical protein
MEGLTYNVGVGVGFIHSWLGGRGTFIYREDVLPTLSAKFQPSPLKNKRLASIIPLKKCKNRKYITIVKDTVSKKLIGYFFKVIPD